MAMTGRLAVNMVVAFALCVLAVTLVFLLVPDLSRAASLSTPAPSPSGMLNQ
jgi:hypothetical protein